MLLVWRKDSAANIKGESSRIELCITSVVETPSKKLFHECLQIEVWHTELSIPGGSPVLDKETKKIREQPSQPRPKQFKCPKCGRGVVAKKLPEVYAQAYKEIDDKRREQEEAVEKEQRLKDGQPHAREQKDEEFMG